MEISHQKDDHNHADENAWSYAELQDRAKYLSEHANQPWMGGERKLKLQREIGLIAFEIWHRDADARAEL